MSLKLWMSLILTSTLAGNPHHAYACLYPVPGQVLWGKVGGSAFIPCNVLLAPPCRQKIFEVRWFVFDDVGHKEVVLAPGSRYSVRGRNLTIDPLMPHDSGDYFCAVLSTEDPLLALFDASNTLTVTGDVMERPWPILLLVLFALLVIYNLVLMIIIFRKKAGPRQKGSVGKSKESEKHSTESRRQQFRSVVQELYNRKNLQRRADNVHTDEPPAKVSVPLNDDIYENL